jgi:hypothetical protein
MNETCDFGENATIQSEEATFSNQSAKSACNTDVLTRIQLKAGLDHIYDKTARKIVTSRHKNKHGIDDLPSG